MLINQLPNMKRIAFILTFLLIALSSAHAQKLTERLDSIIPTRRISGRIDSIITVREMRKEQKFDTAYIQRPEGNWTFKATLKATGWKIRSIRHEGVSNVFESPRKQTLSLGMGYRGLSLSASLNPGKMLGKNTDIELSAASYGNQFGGEVFYHRSKDFTTTTTINGKDFNTSDAVDRISMFDASGYYVFNSRRFSYPAAFSQSYMQKRSAGSWMLGASVFYADGHLNPSIANGTSNTQISMLMFGVGCGYGHNFVLPHDWLIHISAIPNFVIAQHNVMTVNDKEERMRYKFPELMNTGRLSVIHAFDKYFTGISAVAHLNIIGNHRDLFMENLKWKGSVFVGMRL